MKTTLLGLAQPTEPIRPETKGQSVYDRFQAEPDCLALAVVDDDLRPSA